MRNNLYLLLLVLNILLSWHTANAAQIVMLTDDYNEVTRLAKNHPIDTTTDVLNLLLPKLTHYTITYQEALLPRAMKLLKEKQNICAYNWIKTSERQKVAIFSQPITFYPSLRLVYDASNVTIPDNALNSDRQLIALNALFVGNDHLLGVVKGRSYGIELDTSIAQLAQKNVYIRSGVDPYSSIHTMLLKNRIQYLVEYPLELKQVMAHFKQQDRLTAIPIANSKPFVFGHIVCSNSSLGQQFIAAVNKGLMQLYNDPRYAQAHITYLPKTEHARFQLSLKQLIETLTNQSSVAH